MTQWERVPIEAQSVAAPLSRAAVFLVMEARDDVAIRDVLGSVAPAAPARVATRDRSLGIGSLRHVTRSA